MMTGKIVKGIAGFYYVHAEDGKTYECRARGIFRKEGTRPLVGDDVEVRVLDADRLAGSVERVLERRNELARPAVANVDQALAVFAVADPEPSLGLLDRFLVSMGMRRIDAAVCFNKTDIAPSGALERLRGIYGRCGCPILFSSVRQGEGVGAIRDLLQGKTTVLAGPSGVGKSSLVNLLRPDARIETGGVSEKTRRGRHTTRHSELLSLEGSAYVMDTPGFGSLDVGKAEREDLWRYFGEFLEYGGQCRFAGCSHISEPGCAVKMALLENRISKERYDSYRLMYAELSERKSYR